MDQTKATGSVAAVAVISGGASGFGLALGGQCAQRGMQVILLDRDGDRAVDEARVLADAHGVDALGMAVNVSNAAEAGISEHPPFW